jgi:hypothetical protein
MEYDMEYDSDKVRAALPQLATAAAPYPPEYLLAAFLTVVDSPADAVSYCTSQYLDDSSAASWSLVSLAGESVVRIKATGPTVEDPNAPPEGSMPQATTLEVTTHRFAVVEAVSVKIADRSRDLRRLVWRRTWTVHFTDGDRFEMPTSIDRHDDRERADRLASAILAKLRAGH